MSNTANKDVVRRFLDDTLHNRLEAFEALVAEDVVLHGFSGGNPHDRAEYREFFVVLNAAFPGMRFSTDSLIADDEFVAARFTVQGVHRADLAGIPATGRTVEFTGMVIYRLRENRICETWLQPDNLTMLQQLGALPAAA